MGKEKPSEDDGRSGSSGRASPQKPSKLTGLIRDSFGTIATIGAAGAVIWGMLAFVETRTEKTVATQMSLLSEQLSSMESRLASKQDITEVRKELSSAREELKYLSGKFDERAK